MAKRINVQGIISKEIEKGNIYVMDNGNFVSEDNLKQGIMDEFKRGLKDGSVDMTTSFADFQKNKLDGMRKADDLLSHINNFFIPSETRKDDATC